MPVPLHNEQELKAFIAQGSETAFTTVFHHYRHKVFTVAGKITGSRTLAEEIVQDVFLKLWIKRQQLRDVRDLDAFLFIMTRNECFSALKKIAMLEARDVRYANGTGEISLPPHAGMEIKEYRKMLADAVDRLPAQQRMVWMLSKEEELTRENIAARMGISPETVKQHLKVAMRSLRAYLMQKMDIPVVIVLLSRFL